MRLFTRDSLERMGVTTRSVQSERGPRVKLHRNAKTTPTMRALIVQRIRQDQWPPTEAAAAAGISVRTTYKWLRRHRLGGRPALEDASSRPHRQPRRTAPAVTAASWRRAMSGAPPGPSPCSSRSRARRSPPSWRGPDSIGWRASRRRRPSSATNGPIPATWCISMSNRSRASPASATGFMAIAGRACRHRLGVRARRDR